MKFEITGDDLTAINESLEELIEAFEKEYAESLERAKNSRKAKMFGISKMIERAMPESIVHVHYIKDDKVILKNSLSDNALARRSGMYKKTIRGIEGFLKDYKKFKNIEVKMVKHKVD